MTEKIDTPENTTDESSFEVEPSETLKGRPPKAFSKKQFEYLCMIQCTQDEICGIFSIHRTTLDRKLKQIYGAPFAQVYPSLSANGKMSLRRKQFEVAIERENTQMLIWLGKNVLGQTDKTEQTITSPEPIRLAYALTDQPHPRKEDQDPPPLLTPDITENS